MPALQQAPLVGGNCYYTFQFSTVKFQTLLILILLSQSLFGQLTSIGKPRMLTKEEELQDSANQRCIRLTKFSAIQRLNNFPFNKSSEVRLVSFGLKANSFSNEIPKKKKLVDLSQLIESITLNSNQIDSLSDILYNTGYQGIFYSFGDGCYIPRNAILFIDSSGKVFAYIELCFQCGGFKVSSKKVKAGEFCIEKYALLETFFRNAGIKSESEETD
jgi:hypothetical protein